MRCEQARRACAGLVLRALVLGAVAAILLLGPAVSRAQEEEDQSLGELETQVQASMRDAVYKQLAKAQELAEAGEYPAAIERLDTLRSKEKLNSYELAQAWNLYAYIYYSQDSYPKAIHAYEQLLAQADLPEAMRRTTIGTLAQLYFSTERWQKAVETLEQVIKIEREPKTQTYELLAQAHYQLGQYRQALAPAKKVLELMQREGTRPTEQAYLLLRVLYYELEDYKQVAAVLEELIKRFPQKTYWMQLISIYGELEDQQQQLRLLELAYLQGFLDQEAQLVTLASMLLQNDLPFKAGKILEQGLTDKVISPTRQHWRLLAQAWTLAHEDERAIPALVKAAGLDDTGELDLVLAQVYMNLDRWQEAATAIRRAIDKGGLSRTDQAQIMLGQVLFTMGKLDESRAAFTAAQTDKRSRKLAVQWMSFIDNEEARQQQLEAALE